MCIYLHCLVYYNIWGWGGRSGTLGRRSPGASFGFYVREAFQSQTNTDVCVDIRQSPKTDVLVVLSFDLRKYHILTNYQIE